MPTLSKVKFEFLKVAKWAGVVAGVFLIFYLIAQTIMFFKNSSTRNQPGVAFGILTKIDFPKGIENNFTYSIDTITGALPAIPSQVKVYKMIRGEPDLLAVERTSDRVASLGFKDKPEQISDVVFRWRSQTPFSKTLTVNVLNPEFNLTSAFISDPDILSAAKLPSEEKAISAARNFTDTLSFLPDNLDESATKIKLLRIENGAVVKASSISNAQLLSVYFFQKKDAIPFVYPAGGLSSMNLTIGGGAFNPAVVDARFFYQKTSDKSSTYPTISAQDAFERLKKGDAYISSHDGNDTNIFIKKVYLAYFSPSKEQSYLLPVVVFEGNANFFAYVSAVRDEWVSN